MYTIVYKVPEALLVVFIIFWIQGPIRRLKPATKPSQADFGGSGAVTSRAVAEAAA